VSETEQDTTAEDPDAGSETDETPVYANRAARRAKGKAAAQPPPHGKGQRAGGRGSVQGPRQWGNRRSG
jgi:hypothetical protein